MEIETAVIRQFLRERFDDEELDALCFDYFADVQHDFTLGMTKGQKIQLLLDHCRRQNRLPDLLAALDRERPDLYKNHFGEAAVVAKTAVPRQPGPRNPRQIFISHANRDAEMAHRLAQDLRTYGWRVWIAPDSIQPGEKWVEAIGRGLEESGLFVLVVTAAAADSRWVKHEVNLAIQLETKGKMVSCPYWLNKLRRPLCGRLTNTFANGSQKEPVNVIVEKANGGRITTSGDMDRGDEKIVTTLLSSDLSGVRIKIFRWAPGFLGAQGSGGGEAFLTLPTTGDVAISIEVLD